ncbi:MAG: hypothetical protein ACRD0J_10480 [Acidimicrobiales bacterium]
MRLAMAATVLAPPAAPLPPAAPPPLAAPPRLAARGVAIGDQYRARRELRRQIARLERELGEAFVTAFEIGLGRPAAGGVHLHGLEPPAAGGHPHRLGPPASGGHPHLPDLGELELVCDELARRVREAQLRIRRGRERQAHKRELLARMLLAPAEHKFARISCRELGEPGCGVWQVRPRLGLIGMLMGWWQVKLSSGCPLPGGHGPARRRTVARF